MKRIIVGCVAGCMIPQLTYVLGTAVGLHKLRDSCPELFNGTLALASVVKCVDAYVAEYNDDV